MKRRKKKLGYVGWIDQSGLVSLDQSVWNPIVSFIAWSSLYSNFCLVSYSGMSRRLKHVWAFGRASESASINTIVNGRTEFESLFVAPTNQIDILDTKMGFVDRKTVSKMLFRRTSKSGETSERDARSARCEL